MLQIEEYKMIIIACDNYEEAEINFWFFHDILELNAIIFIKEVFEHSLCIEMEDDLRYIFMDYHYIPFFQDIKPDVVDVEKFFEDIENYYLMPDQHIERR